MTLMAIEVQTVKVGDKLVVTDRYGAVKDSISVTASEPDVYARWKLESRDRAWQTWYERDVKVIVDRPKGLIVNEEEACAP